MVRALDMSKIVLFLLVLFFMAQGSSELYINSSQTVFEADTDLQFVFDASDPGNYTLNISDASGGVYGLENMTRINPGPNSSELLYGLNYSTKAPYGERSAEVFSRDPNVSVTDSGQVFHVTGDEPNVLEYRIKPPIRFIDQTLTAEVRVADSRENVGVSEITVENSKFPMKELNNSEENVQVFSTDFNLSEVGQYSYQVDLVDSGGLSTSVSDSFVLESGPRSSSTNISVTVDNECFNLTSTFSAPGNEPVNIITRNTTGSFLAEFFNSGNIAHQTLVDLDITFEGNTSWTKGEEPGPVVLSYESKNFSIPANGRGEYYRRFDAVYEPGNYTGRMQVSSSCIDESDNKTLRQKFNLTDKFQIVDVEGEDSLLENGSQTTNQSIPADASRRGSESDQTLEGDNPEPGSTVQPEPEPQPSLSLNMETLNVSYTTGKNTFKEIGLNVENYADLLEQVQLTPQVGDVEGDWNVRSATLGQIGSQQSLNTSVFLQPGENVPAGNYRIPVMARLTSGRSLDVEYIDIEVTEQILESNLSILESPQVLELQRNSSTQIPVLLENSGNRKLENVSLQAQNLNQCVNVERPDPVEMPVNDTNSQSLVLRAGGNLETCQGLIIASSDSGAYAFANIRVEVVPQEGFVPEQFRVPLIASLWTVLLLAYAIITRRFDMHSYMVKIPFLLLIVGETVIFLYLAANYYGLVPGQLLPF